MLHTSKLDVENEEYIYVKKIINNVQTT